MSLISEESRSLGRRRQSRIKPIAHRFRSWDSVAERVNAPSARSPHTAVQIKELPWGYRIAKRSIDLIVSSVALLMLLPVFILIVAVIRLTSPGSALYRSKRIGLGGRTIWFLKFRTMRSDADSMKDILAHLNNHDGPIFKAKNDPRITSVGRFLRKFSLDELPQFIHVFLGEMTLVGPRPHLPCEVEHYGPEDRLRLSVKPGLTCFWQVSGRSDLSFEEWIRLDLKYVQEQSLLTDLKLLAITPIAVLGGKGAY
jgi:lipopolysaccharide/colanic/teichoic acid biosynthesis glycosyltransferase